MNQLWLSGLIKNEASLNVRGDIATAIFVTLFNLLGERKKKIEEL